MMDQSGNSDHAARVGAIAKRLDDLTARLERRHDSRCVFTYAYAIMTRRIGDDLDVRSDVDPAWIVSLAEAFADRYFAAVDAYDAGELESRAWQAVFDALGHSRTSALEDLVFAMSAHIIHDLPLALGDVSPLRHPESGRIYDFHAVNDMMDGAIEIVQREVALRYSPGLGRLDKLAEGYDEILTSYGTAMSRGLAWYNALRLADARARKSTKIAIEHSPELLVSNVLNPPTRSLRLVFRMLRLLVRLGRRWPSDDPRAAAREAADRARAAARA
jgi:hypothetical protein